jgi:hypothetical protein
MRRMKPVAREFYKLERNNPIYAKIKNEWCRKLERSQGGENRG